MSKPMFNIWLTNTMTFALRSSFAARNTRGRLWAGLMTRCLSPQMKDRVKLKSERGKGVQAAIVPDGYFRLRTNEDTYNFFVEIDRGTVTGEATEWGRRDWGRKIKAYLEYYRSGLYERRYGTRDLRILTVTTGETRLAHLKAVTEEAGGKGRFWFSTFDRIKHGDVLSDSLWNVAAREGLVALIS